MEPVFSCAYFQAFGILPSPMPCGCRWGFGLSQRSSIGASGWYPEAPILFFHFSFSLPPWLLPRVGNGNGQRLSVAPVHLLDDGSNSCKRVRLTRKTRPGVSSHVAPDPGHPTLRRWKRLLPPPSEGEVVRWACLAIFFLDLGLGEVCTWGRLEPARRSGSRLVSPAEGTSALALVRF